MNAELAKQLTQISKERYINDCLNSIYKEIKKVATVDGGTKAELFFEADSEFKCGITQSILENLKQVLQEQGFRVWLGSSRKCGGELGISIRW